MDMTIAVMNGVLITGIIGLALRLQNQELISVGAIVPATGLVIRINNMSGWIMWMVDGIFENTGQVQDNMQTIALPCEVVDREDAQPLRVERGEVEFERIAFHYGKDSGMAQGLNPKVRPGKKTGLVGPSGVSKPTLVNLLLHLHDLESGRILIDGQDIVGATRESLCAQIGMVIQDTSLLHRSIRDNLLYGRSSAGNAELMEAVCKAHVDEFIPLLSNAGGRRGFDVHVSECGVKLSGGQRQRIAIAQVLLKDALILILDEVTSALDSEAESVIRKSPETLMQDKTVIAIAYRLSAIVRMDRLMVLDKGHIAESGTYAELLAHGGFYACLWQHQTGGLVGVD